MAFADLLPLDGRDLVWLLEVSTDKFATVAYRWATHAGDIGGNFFEQRIVKNGVGNINRGLGNDHLPVASATSIVLDNSDFGADWLVARATVESIVFKARFRLSIGLSDTSANVYQSTILTQQVGTFVCLDMPTRDNEGRVVLSLADDALGQLSDILVPPTLYDWTNAFSLGTETSGCFDTDPITNPPVPLSVDFTTPVALQFGGAYGPSPYTGFPMCTFRTTRAPADFDAAFFGAGRHNYIYPIIVLATRDSAAIAAGDVTSLRGVYRKDVIHAEYLRGQTESIPSTASLSGTTLKIWKAYKTDTITLAGPDGVNYDWKLLWVAMDIGAFASWRSGIQIPTGQGIVPQNQYMAFAPEFDVPSYSAGGGAPATPTVKACNGMFAAFDYFGIVGAPGSAITGISNPQDAGNPASILQDLVQYYSVMGATGVDTTRFTKAALSRRFRVRGEIVVDVTRPAAGQVLASAQSPFGVGNLRKAIAEIASSADLDVFVTMAGKVALVSQAADFDTQTTVFPTVDEERMANVKERVPSAGERWAPYNRVYVQRQAPWWAEQGQNLLFGPYDEPTAIAAWGRIITKVLAGKWWQQLQTNPGFGGLFFQSPTNYVWAMRNLEAKVRGILEFTTDVGILALELGDYFTTSWTRGGNNAAYSAALWRLESVNIRPDKGEVDVAAVWMGDLQTDQPYLLDSEALIIRTTPAAGQTLTVTDGSTTVVRSAGSFVADGVAVGDVVRVRDATEAASAFLRNKDVRVVTVTDATHLVVSSSVWSPAGAHVVADTDWSVLRGALTYHTSSSDPVNYPSGGAMYGKVASSLFAGKFSDNATAANKLLD